MPRKLAVSNTQAGTPCARSWSGDWIAAINTIESQLNHRICGARLADATPCTNESDHNSGRCSYHGGFDLTGAPSGNRNGVIHGLYSRRLRTCSQSCPFWKTCPLGEAKCANQDSSIQSTGSTPSMSVHVRPCPSDKSDLSADLSSVASAKEEIRNPQLPLCPYQLTEYNTVVTDALAVVESQPHPNPMGIHAAHNVAMLQVLASSAAAHLANTPTGARASSPCSSDPDSDAANLANPNATLAFIRLMREFRAALKVLQMPVITPLSRQKNVSTAPSPEGVARHIERTKHDTNIDPDSLIDAQIEDQPEHLHAKAYLRQSIEAASQGRDVEMAEAFDNVIQFDEQLAESERDHVLVSYRPGKQTVSEETAAQILGNLHLPPLPTPEGPDDGRFSNDQNDAKVDQESAKILKEYLDIFRDGKIPPEAFPIGSPIREYAASIYTAHDPAPT